MSGPRINYAPAFAALLLIAILSPMPGASASSITIKWAEPHDDKILSIESGPTKLFEKKLEGDSVQVDTEAMLGQEIPHVAAIVSVEGFDELAIAVNLFRCSAPCNWRITFSALEDGTSMAVNRICQSNPKPMDSQFKKYFFCRKTFQRNIVANDKCWDITLSALTGWFDAAYKLHEMTLKDGIGFFARDADVEREIELSLEACPKFEETVKRNKGYFKGMIRNLNVAILQQAQRVEKALAADKPAEASGIAEEMLRQLDAIASVREIVSVKDADYVESIVNRALVRDTQFAVP